MPALGYPVSSFTLLEPLLDCRQQPVSGKQLLPGCDQKWLPLVLYDRSVCSFSEV
ncbi:hypothetical protein DPMN_142524 [Dreissena polymorpha]|uniref:Uncharacterized protein n=1 Tax=Dreissena polymorpha TaxID=45954 RepID=A0A9D4GEL3_DREPO|nr:hypothetical protein DPMN_142524 [Dreissena polymorpha]